MFGGRLTGGEESGMAEARKVVAARVIPWENQYGIAVVFERGKGLHKALGLGTI